MQGSELSLPASTILSSVSGSSDVNPDSRDVTQPKRQIRPHNKSRGGCFHCKRRRVKCQQTRPACDNCTRNFLRCTYPATDMDYAVITTQPAVPQVQSMTEMYPGKLEYTALDMQLLHHFLTAVGVTPHLPIGKTSIWRHEVMCLAHEYNFLMHALLSLSASQIMSSRDRLDLLPISEFHRVRALTGINTILDQSEPCSAETDDALLGACFAMAFQTAHQEEDLKSFLIVVRSCTACMIRSKQMQKRCLFADWGESPWEGTHWRLMEGKLKDFPLLSRTLTEYAIGSLQALEVLCRDDLERTVSKGLRLILNAVRRSSFETYKSYSHLFLTISTLSHESFTRLMANNEPTLSLLICHFFATQTFLVPIFTQEWIDGFGPVPAKDTERTLRRLRQLIEDCVAILQPELLMYLDWPRLVERMLLEGTFWDSLFEGERPPLVDAAVAAAYRGEA